jgi:hypothetical protein
VSQNRDTWRVPPRRSTGVLPGGCTLIVEFTANWSGDTALDEL